jgi:hypothetical protein
MSPFCAVFANISVHATAQEDQTPLDDGDAGMSIHQSCLSIRVPTILFSIFLLLITELGVFCLTVTACQGMSTGGDKENVVCLRRPMAHLPMTSHIL